MGHDEEGGAGHAFIGAIQNRLRHRKALRGKRADHPVFAIDGMRGGQQFAGRFAAQNVAAQRRFNQISRIGLAALELTDHRRSGKSRDVFAQIGFETRDIEAKPLGDLAGAGKVVLAVGARHDAR